MMNCRIWERFKMPRLTEMVSLMISTMATTAGYGRGPYTALHMFPMLPISVNISLFKTNIWSMSDFTYTNYQNQDQCKKKSFMLMASSTSGKCLSIFLTVRFP